MERKVYCLNKISKVGLGVLPSNYKVVEELEGADAVLVRSAAMHEMELPESVVAVARAGAGVNNIPLDKYAEKGVVVFNTPGANANAVKELTIAMMLLAARDIRGSMEWVKANKEDQEINKSMEKAKGAFAGTEILGKTLGIIGCGAIGALVADAASKLGMKVLGSEPSMATRERYKELLTSVEFVELDELLKRSDYITVHVPLLDATRGMINKVALAKCKDGVIVINAARDALVNDEDMKEALASGKVRRYVTDFPNYKSANTEGVIAISHLGASTEEAEDNCAMMAANQVVNLIENGNIVNSVNYPNLDLGPKAGHRLLVLHKSSESLCDILLETIKKQGKKVSKFVTGSKGSFGASLFELDSEVEVKELLQVEGVIRVYCK